LAQSIETCSLVRERSEVGRYPDVGYEGGSNGSRVLPSCGYITGQRP
jgi:hypothetical protein